MRPQDGDFRGVGFRSMPAQRVPLAPGRRQTEQRRLVWQAITTLGPHCTAEEIAAAIDRQRPGFPRSTVYRALEAFTVSGALRAVRFGDGPTHYEVADHEHQHAICHRCGGILHVEHSLVEAIEQHLTLRHHFHPERTEVIVTGLCRECASGAPVRASKRNLAHEHPAG